MTRAQLWNVAAVLFAGGDLYAAHRYGVLAVVLTLAAGMVAATAVAIVEIERRNTRAADERVAASRALHRLEPAAPASMPSEVGEEAA